MQGACTEVPCMVKKAEADAARWKLMLVMVYGVPFSILHCVATQAKTDGGNSVSRPVTTASSSCPTVLISRALLRMVRSLSGTLVSRCLRSLCDDDGAAFSSSSISMCVGCIVLFSHWKDDCSDCHKLDLLSRTSGR